ncbi:MAG: hypothetical protein BM555_05750 [Crocinitomix sp. MedPE-SWsnd]|jgi:uridine kinase|nr:MAG: hypothetical protein BM555_05750 [Crocinitomix sp. MedPE-SWsnd]
MQIHVLKTDLKSLQEVKTIAPILDLHPQIISWNVDTQDIDNVLRIEGLLPLDEEEIIPLLRQYGVYSETLNY